MKGRLEHQLKNDAIIKKTLVDMPEIVSDYYYAMASSVESTTALLYVSYIRKFLQSISDDVKCIDCAKIRQSDIARFLFSISTKINKEGTGIESTSASYRRTVFAALKNFFDYLELTKVITNNPMSGLKRPQNTDVVHRVRLLPEDMNKILEAVKEENIHKQGSCPAKERDRAILLMFMCTGMRESALTEINLEDIDLENETITIIDKRHKTHTYHMASKLKEALEVWLNKRTAFMDGFTSGALFVGRNHERMPSLTIYNLVKKYSKAGLGYEISPHKLRAAFCTTLYEETRDIEFVRDAVGHATVSVTQRYVVKDDSAKIKSASIMNNLLN